MPGVAAIEIDVEHIESQRAVMLDRHHRRRPRNCTLTAVTPVIYTSRTEKTFADQATRLAFGDTVSAFLMDVVRSLPATLGFLISKGGITSNDVLSSALALRTSRVLGQILPGCSVVRCPDDHPRYPELPVVIFPGNVGDEHAVARAYARLAGIAETPDNATGTRAAALR